MSIYEPRAAAQVPERASSSPSTFQLTADEGASFLRIVSDALRIRRHYEVFQWLNGEVQQFLPHRVLISAWGDFAGWSLQFDVVSALPGVRTEALAHCRIDDLVRRAYTQWVDAGRKPLVLRMADVVEPGDDCGCAIHGALRGMRSLFVHGVRDARNGNESLYLALHSGSFTNGRCSERFVSMVHLLTAQIDLAMRSVAALPLERAGPEDRRTWLDLSSREQEILDCVRQGKTNVDIAAALDISPYTVKNHVQRIFRKIGVRNRTQAAAKYSQAARFSEAAQAG